MQYLLAIEAQNYLSLKNVRVELGDLNVLVGPNATGKSNLLSVISFLGEVARTDLAPAIAHLGGFEALRFHGEGAQKTIRVKVIAQVSRYSSLRAPDEYELSFVQVKRAGLPGFASYLRREEGFKFKRTRGRGRRITVRGRKYIVDDERRRPVRRPLATDSAALSTLQRLGEDEGAHQVRELAELFQTFRVFDLDVGRARRPAPAQDRPKLAADGSNLSAFLHWLSKAHEEVFTLLVEDLRGMIPGFVDIAFVPVGGPEGAVAVELVESGLSSPTPLARASYGTIRALGLLAMLHDPEPPKLTCVEEIDHGLHPYALDLIVERLRSAGRRTQFLIATHSPALVNRLRPEELIVCERSDSGASVIPAVHPDEVAAVAEDDVLGLGELWFSGSLGGVPR